MILSVCLSVVSVWLRLQCQLWPPSGSGQVNPLTPCWEKPMNWSGEWDNAVRVQHSLYNKYLSILSCSHFAVSPVFTERIWASGSSRSRWVTTLQSAPSTLRAWSKTLCFMDPSTPNSSSGGKVWKQSQKAPSRWSCPSKIFYLIKKRWHSYFLKEDLLCCLGFSVSHIVLYNIT